MLRLLARDKSTNNQQLIQHPSHLHEALLVARAFYLAHFHARFTPGRGSVYEPDRAGRVGRNDDTRVSGRGRLPCRAREYYEVAGPGVGAGHGPARVDEQGRGVGHGHAKVPVHVLHKARAVKARGGTGASVQVRGPQLPHCESHHAVGPPRGSHGGGRGRASCNRGPARRSAPGQ